MKQIASAYTYNKTTGVITLTGVNIDRDQLLLIVNTTRNVTYYNFADSATTLQAFTQGTNTSLTLNSSVVTASSAHANADALTIYYDDQVAGSGTVTANAGNGFPGVIYSGILQYIDAEGSIPVSIDPVTDLGAKADAVATTDTGTFSVIAFIKRGLQNWTSLLAKIPALVSGRIPVDGSGVTQSVSGTETPSLPSNYSGDPYPAGTKIIPVGGWTSEEDGAHWQALSITDSGSLYTYTLLAPSTNIIGSVTPAQGTSPANTNFTSTTPNTLIAGAYSGRRVFTVFNEGAGVLHISPTAACTTASYQVRLSAGDYWECPAGQLSLAHTAVFATAGTARVTLVN